MKPADQALEEARRAEIDLGLLDSNLALNYEQRWQMHDEALAKVCAYEKANGTNLAVNTIIRRTKSGVELLYKVSGGYDVQRIA